jgi:hypothetical protein
VTHEARPGRGPGEGFLANTGRGNGRGVYGKFQMLEDLLDDPTMRDGGNDPQRPLLAERAARHIQRQYPLQQSCPAPARRPGVGFLVLYAPPGEGLRMRPVASTTQRVHSRRDCGKIAFEISILHE